MSFLYKNHIHLLLLLGGIISILSSFLLLSIFFFCLFVSLTYRDIRYRKKIESAFDKAIDEACLFIEEEHQYKKQESEEGFDDGQDPL